MNETASEISNQTPTYHSSHFLRFTPLIGFPADTPPDCLLLDISATLVWFGGEETLLAQLVEQLDQMGQPATVAVADTIGAAWGVAHFGPYVLAEQHRSAWGTERVAAWSVSPDDPWPVLSVLPVEALRIEPDVVAWLRELGLRRIGQLAPFSRTQLAERFGHELLRRWDQLTGAASETLIPYREPAEFIATLDFEIATTHHTSLVHVLDRQLQRLVRPLVERNEGLQRLECLLRGESGSILPLHVALLRPTVNVKYLLDLLQLRLEAQRLIEPIAGVRLAALAIAPLESRQRTLFTADERTDDAWLWSSLVERLSSRLGHESVVRARLRSEHQPEYAWSEEPWCEPSLPSAVRPVGVKRNRARRRSGTFPHAGNPKSGDFDYSAPLTTSRPLQLERRPVAVRVVSAEPHSRPKLFVWRDREYPIVRHWGPERIETGWWRGRDVRRDYYRVETSSGQWCWLFRRCPDGAWFLQGWFD